MTTEYTSDVSDKKNEIYSTQSTTFQGMQSSLRKEVPHVSALRSLNQYYPVSFSDSRYVRSTHRNQYIYKRGESPENYAVFNAPTCDEMDRWLDLIFLGHNIQYKLIWTYQDRSQYWIPILRFQYQGSSWVEISCYSSHKPSAFALLIAKLGESYYFQQLTKSAADVQYPPVLHGRKERLICIESEEQLDCPLISEKEIVLTQGSPSMESAPESESESESRKELVQTVVSDAPPALDCRALDVRDRVLPDLPSHSLVAKITPLDVLQYVPYTIGQVLHQLFIWAQYPDLTDKKTRCIKIALWYLRIAMKRPGAPVPAIAVTLYQLLAQAYPDSPALYIGLFVIDEKFATAIQLLTDQEKTLEESTDH